MNEDTFRNINAASAGTIATLTGETRYDRQREFLNWTFANIGIIPEGKTWMRTVKLAWDEFEKMNARARAQVELLGERERYELIDKSGIIVSPGTRTF